MTGMTASRLHAGPHFKVVVREPNGQERRNSCGTYEGCVEQARRENGCARGSGRVYRVEPCAACAAAVR